MKKLITVLIPTILFIGILIINSCKKDVVIPTLSTADATNITVSSVTTGGNITKDGGAGVSARGVCYGTTTNPTISGSHTSDDNGTGAFVSTITGLTSNTLYHIRAYATNKAGTAYGEEITVTTVAIVVPVLTTADATSVTYTSAVSGGNITSDGNGNVTARGVCWATSANPTITNDKTTDGTGSGTFVSNLSGLLPSTTYYVRAYATNSAGTSYGNSVSFTTTALGLATLTTTAASSITLTSASSGGNITADGGANITARGVCWATTANPTITNAKTSDGTGTGIFTSSLTGLTAGTTYHIRAYATNSVGTAYGNDLTFAANAVSLPTISTTAISSITLVSAVSGGNVTSDGGGTVTARGVCWATTTGPTIAGNKTTDGAGVGSFSSSLTSLVPGATYYVRAYATNSAGTAYGNEISFVTTSASVPSVTTTALSAITQTTAVSGGNVTGDGGISVTARGVCWSTTVNPTISNSKTTDGTGTGIFTSNLSALLAGTTYHVRAYATNSAGTAYGNDITFTTTPAVVGSITTTEPSSITLTTASSGGTITSDGGASITARGVCWATSSNPTITDAHTSDGTGLGTFVSSITGLLPGTTYHIRAYATNSAGTTYGNDVAFSTVPVVVPTITTNAITSITATTATSGGDITSNGGGAITASGICWSNMPNPTILNSLTTDGSVSGSFSSNLTGLASGITYYVRAYATNSAGTAYGNQRNFSIVPTTGTVTDIEGNVYNTVLIGTQWWMAENLKTWHFNTGNTNADRIPNVQNSGVWSSLTGASPAGGAAYSYYFNDSATYKNLYGALYNQFAIQTGNLCPAGWHVPTDGDWGTLEGALGMEPDSIAPDLWFYRGSLSRVGDQLKSATGWTAGGAGTNTSGFSGLPGGYRSYLNGAFLDEISSTYWWSSSMVPPVNTAAWHRLVDRFHSSILRGAVDEKGGKYVRCLKD